MTKQEIRNQLITGSFMIGPDGLKEPPDWHSYSELLEDEIIKYEERNINLHLKNIKDKTEAYKELSSLSTQLTEMTAEKNKWFDRYAEASQRVDILDGELRITQKKLEVLAGMIDK